MQGWNDKILKYSKDRMIKEREERKREREKKKREEGCGNKYMLLQEMEKNGGNAMMTNVLCYEVHSWIECDKARR